MCDVYHVSVCIEFYEHIYVRIFRKLRMMKSAYDGLNIYNKYFSIYMGWGYLSMLPVGQGLKKVDCLIAASF